MSIKILGISGSPRRNGSSEIMMEEALKGAASVQDIVVERCSFAGKDIRPCNALCVNHCKKTGLCAIKDDFEELRQIYMEADGVIWSAPVYHAGPPAQVKCALDRLANVIWMYFDGKMPRLNKVCAALVQGSSRWGGQELAIQFLINSFILMKCIPVAGDTPKSYFGVAGYSPTWELGSIREDKIALDTAFNAGIRVAEMARIYGAGKNALKDELPPEYFPEKFRKNKSD